MDEQKTYLITYDISDDKRRLKTADVLLSYGHRVLESVFVVKVRGAKFLRMKDAVLMILDRKADTLLICDLGQSNNADRRITRYGSAMNMNEEAPCIF